MTIREDGTHPVSVLSMFSQTSHYVDVAANSLYLNTSSGVVTTGLVESVDMYPSLAVLAGLPLPHDVAGGTPSVQEEQVAMPEVEWQEGTFPEVEWQRAHSLAGVFLL